MLDIMTAAPRPVRLGNQKQSRELLVGALKLTEFGVLQRWIRDHCKTPLEMLDEDLKHAPESEHRRLRYEAWVEQRDDWPPAPYTAKGIKALFADIEGHRFFLEVMLRKHNVISDEEITFYMGCLGIVDMDALATIAFGADDLDPKEVWAMVRAMRQSEPPTARPSPESSRAEVSAEPGANGSIETTSSLLTDSLASSPN